MGKAKRASAIFLSGGNQLVDGAGMSYTNVDQVQRHHPVAITDLRLHVLTEGFRYDLVSRQPELPRSARGL
jgi:cyanophycinase-like exopeptidase